MKLLMRFYDVNSGEIRIDGHPITHISRGALRQNIGMVLQDTWLFHGTIMENIRYGRLDATDEEVIAAAKAARAPSQKSRESPFPNIRNAPAFLSVHARCNSPPSLRGFNHRKHFHLS